MDTENKKKLFFVKTPSHNLKSIETFLSKRNFVVHTAIDIQEALIKAIEVEPDFIFIAWDHNNPKIVNLPKLLQQTLPCPIIPYIMSNSKEANRKLNFCPMNPKLFPPVSGPAIERLVLKLNKQITDDQSGRAKGKNLAVQANQNELIQIKSKLLAEFESSNAIETTDSENLSGKDEVDFEEAANHSRFQSSIKRRNDILKKSNQFYLPAQAVNNLKNTLQDKIKNPLKQLLNTLEESEQFDNDAPNLGPNLTIQKGFVNENLGSVMQEGFNTESIGTEIQKGFNNENPGSAMEKGQGTETLGTEIQKQFRLEKSVGLSATADFHTYCLSIYSDNWCGYLVITTDTVLDFSSVDLIFSDWIRLEFNNLQEIEENDFFEIQIKDSSAFMAFNKRADYSESIQIDQHTININFFSVDPNQMLIELNEDKDFIKVRIEDIPSDMNLNFSLNLHFPENKKYILYTQSNKSLSIDQKNRLKNNNIYLLYTPVSYEKEYKKFIAEKKVKELSASLAKNNKAL